MKVSEKHMQQCDEGITLMNKGQHADAAMLYTDLLLKDDTVALAWNNRGLCLMNLGHPFDAVMNIDRAIALEPKTAEYVMNKGCALAALEKMDKAIELYNTAIELNPNLSTNYMNMGCALKWLDRLPEALPYFRKSAELGPTEVYNHLNLAFAELEAGNYEAGFKEFEWRWKSDQMPPRGLPLPEWDGSDLTGKTIFVYGEQGFGDALQFVRYAPLLKQKYDCKVIVEVRQPLVRLVGTMDGIDEVICFGENVKVKEIDWAIPMMSLPRLFGTTVDTIPWSGPYFNSDKHPIRVNMWQEQLKHLNEGLRIGLCWAGQSRPGRPAADAIDKRRSVTLAQLAPLAKVPGVKWVSLQKGIPRDQIEKPPTGMTIGDWTDMLDDFYDTAALIECLDLVISVDTAVVHLAAALGKPTWLLSRWDNCWRWLGKGPNSPWYPTLRQFTQPAPYAWNAVMETAAVALREFVKGQTKKAA